MSIKGSKGDVGRNELIRIGGTVSTLATMFSRDINTVKRAIAKQGLLPTITPDGRELYSVPKIAPFLIDISEAVDIAEIIKNTSLKKLPPELTKNFWDAANARKKHLEDNGELWRTDAVMEVLVDVFKTLRQSVNQFVDTVADRTEITEKQRQLIVEMADGLLGSMREKLIEDFELYSPLSDERDDFVTRSDDDDE